MTRQEAQDRGVPNLWLLLEQLTIRTGCDTDLNRSADLAMREFSDLLAAPVPTPSADARAKLEQDIVEDHSRALEFLRELDQFGSRVREWLHTERAALPPHEGERPPPRMVQNDEGGWNPRYETPQPAAESGWRDGMEQAAKICDGQIASTQQIMREKGVGPELRQLAQIRCETLEGAAMAIREMLPPVVQTRPEETD